MRSVRRATRDTGSPQPGGPGPDTPAVRASPHRCVIASRARLPAKLFQELKAARGHDSGILARAEVKRSRPGIRPLLRRATAAHNARASRQGSRDQQSVIAARVYARHRAHGECARAVGFQPFELGGSREIAADVPTHCGALMRSLPQVPVRLLHAVSGACQPLADFVRDQDTAMMSAGAAEGDGQVRLALADIVRQQVNQQIGDALDEFLVCGKERM